MQTGMMLNWGLTETLCYLRHLELADQVAREPTEGAGPERWVPTLSNSRTKP
jgi:hypothetical protein